MHARVAWGVAGSLVFLLACGNGGGGDKPTPPPAPQATGLAYADPTGAGYRLVRSSTSTAGKLVLDLMGPASDQGRGVSFTCTVDAAKASFVKMAEGDPECVQNGSTFELGATSPKLLKGLRQEGALSVVVSQKGTGNAKPLGGVLARIALQLKTDAALAPNTSISFAVSNAKALPAIGTPTAISIATGSLVAQ